MRNIVPYLIKAGLLEGASRCRVHLRVDGGNATVHHLEVEGSRELKSAKEYSKVVTGARSQKLFRKRI